MKGYSTSSILATGKAGGQTNDILDPSLNAFKNCFISTIFRKRNLEKNNDTSGQKSRISNIFRNLFGTENESKFDIIGSINNVPNSFEFHEKDLFYNHISLIFSKIYHKLLIKLSNDNGNNNKSLYDLIYKSQEYNVIVKMQDYQLNSEGIYNGGYHHEGLLSDNIKLVCIYVIEQDSCLNDCALTIDNSVVTNKVICKENMAILFTNEYDKSHQVKEIRNTSKNKSGSRKILIFWILDNKNNNKEEIVLRQTYPSMVYNCLNTHVNLRFDAPTIICRWYNEMKRNDNDFFPKDLLLLMVKFVCGDLEYMFNQQTEFRNEREKHEQYNVSRFDQAIRVRDYALFSPRRGRCNYD